jgi:hypothetical protein
VTWERRPIDPLPGPRRLDEIEGAEPLVEGAVLATPQTRGPGGFAFAESNLARILDEPVLLVDPHDGPRAIAATLDAAAAALGCDTVVLVDVGGDVLAHGDEAGLASQRISEAGMLGAWGLTPDAAERLEAAIEVVPTEASANVLRAFRGVYGEVSIREGRRRVELSPIAAVCFFYDCEKAIAGPARLAASVVDADSLAKADAIIASLGIRTEFQYEKDAGGPTSGDPLRPS